MSYVRDVAAVVKGCQLVGRAVIREQLRTCERNWETGSLKPCADKALERLVKVSSETMSGENLLKVSADVAARGQVFVQGVFKGLPVVLFGGESEKVNVDEFQIDHPIAEPFMVDKETVIVHATTNDTIPSGTDVKNSASAHDTSKISGASIKHASNSSAAKPANDMSKMSAAPVNKEMSTDKVEHVKLKVHGEKQTLNETSRQRKVPTSRLSRLATYGNLAVGLSFGALTEVTKRSLGLSKQIEGGGLLDQNPFLTEENAERIVNTLCRARGAALKLGQMLSIQDNSFINPQLQKIFERVRFGADFMPTKQLNKTIEKELGPDWQKLFRSFDETPIAAASIGQVHSAVLQDGREVALKIQYPGVADGIESDIKNLVAVMTFGNILPKGLYLSSLVKVAREELALECDYLRETQSSKRFKLLISDDPSYYVPYVVDELTTQKVYTTELIYGLPLDKCVGLDQETRNWLGEKMLSLCLRELFEFRFMQTDPNWSNFFYDAQAKRIILLDFGACRDFGKKFTDQYMKIIKAAADKDRKTVLEYSRKIGFLTGYETKIMEDAHCEAVAILGEAFASEEILDFSTQNTTSRIQELVPTMIKHRLTPPPEEIYSLHRKLSGAFLLCAKLKSQVPCKRLFDETFREYKFDTQ